VIKNRLTETSSRQVNFNAHITQKYEIFVYVEASYHTALADGLAMFKDAPTSFIDPALSNMKGGESCVV
jgi:hypothetical protein